jgi:hypothetical protein
MATRIAAEEPHIENTDRIRGPRAPKACSQTASPEAVVLGLALLEQNLLRLIQIRLWNATITPKSAPHFNVLRREINVMIKFHQRRR